VNSPTKYQMTMGLMSLLSSDGDISSYALTQFGKEPSFYAAEDYARLGDLEYPFVHGFCYNKTDTDQAVTYSLVMEVSALREVDTQNRFVHNQVGSVITEAIHGKIDTWVQMIAAQLREDLAVVGINGVKGFEIVYVSDATLPPQGQEDIRCMLNFDIQLDKCI